MTARTDNSPMVLAILGLLSQEPRSGYDLLKIFSETAMGGFSSSPGAIYPALKRLEKQGCVAGTIQNRDTLRPRRIFRLTQAGKRSLEQRLRAEITLDDVMRHEDAIMLRFVFAGELLGHEEAIRILDQFAQRIDDYLPSLETQLAAHPTSNGRFGVYALQHGIELYRSHARWARATIAKLRRQSTKNG